MKATYRPLAVLFFGRRRRARGRWLERILAAAGLTRGSRLPDDIRLAAA